MKAHELQQKLQSLSTTHFCDASPHIRIFDINIQRLTKNSSSWAGRALTVLSEGDILPGFQAVELATEGDVLVMTADTYSAVVGEILTTAAKKKGVVGIVIDGYCRDIDAIRELSMPFYAKGMNPKAGTKDKLGQLNQSIMCGNIRIEPRDIIFGDDSGLIAMSEAEFHELLPIATEIKNKEIEVLARLKHSVDTSLTDISNVYEHIENIKNQKPSRLKWL